MKLKEKIETALELTEQLQLALKEGQFELFATFLDEREAAMAEFQAAHEDANDDVRTACGELIDTLQQNDAQLQQEAAVALTVAGDQMRANVGTTVHYKGSYSTQPDLACVDRKA